MKQTNSERNLDSQRLPSLIIAGANRAGTTSLYTYLARHKKIGAAAIKETNYFMPVVYGKKLASISEYAAHFSHCTNENILMEASPRYFFGGGIVAQEIYDNLGKIHIIFSLRDPVTRLFSYYLQRKASNEIPENIFFDEYSKKAINEYHDFRKKDKNGIINVHEVSVYLRGLSQGLYWDYLAQWFDVFEGSAKIIFFEDLKKDSRNLMLEICDWLQIDSDIYSQSDFGVENRTVNYKSMKIHTMAGYINDKFESFFRRNHYIKKFLRSIYYALNEQSNNKEKINEDTKNLLKAFYQPFNRKLLIQLQNKNYNRFPDWLSGDLNKL